MTAILSCLMSVPHEVEAQTREQPVIEMIGDRTLIYVDRLKLRGDETVMDVLMMYPELLVNGFDQMLDTYQLRMENVNLACNLRQFLSTTPARKVKRIQICENPVVAKGTTGLGGVIDLNMHRNEDGASGFIGGELTTKLEKSVLAAVNYGYVSPGKATTDIYASANVDDYSRHGDTEFNQNVSFNLTQRFDQRNRLLLFLRQTCDRTSQMPSSADVRAYVTRAYYYHTFNKIGTELTCVAGYMYNDYSNSSTFQSLGNNSRLANGIQTYMVELNTPLPFLKGLQLMVGNEDNLTHLRNQLRQDMARQPKPFDVSDRFNVNCYDLYAQFDYKVGPMLLSVGDRVSFYHYSMDAHNGKYSRNPTRNMIMASAVARLSACHQVQGGYYRRYINPSFLEAMPVSYPDVDGTTWRSVTQLANESRADVYRLAYVFCSPSVNASFGGRYIHLVDEKENSMQLNASATWIHSWLMLTGGANFCHESENGEKLNYGYIRLAPTFRIPWGVKASAQLVWCSKNAPERRLLEGPAVYGLLKAEKTISSHVALTAQWHDMFNRNRHAAMLTARYLF